MPQLPDTPSDFTMPSLPPVQDNFSSIEPTHPPLEDSTHQHENVFFTTDETYHEEEKIDEPIEHFASSTQELKKTITENIFEDVKEEMETFVLKHVPFESYPSYSLYISQIHTGIQRNSIKLLLKEYQLLQSETEIQLVHRSLQLKHLLIPRISEYAAIYFANKLEHLKLKIQFSPSEDLSGHHESWDQGPITNESFHHHKEQFEVITPDIFISQAYSVADKRVQLLGEVLQQTYELPKQELEHITSYFKNFSALKEQAKLIHANAIVGLRLQPLEQNDSDHILFLITGEAARIQDE